MAGSFNRVLLMGRVTADPEVPRTLPNSGTTVVKFRLAVGRSKKNPQTGQWENDPNPLYIDCECFDYPDAKRKVGNVISQYVKKGDAIFIEGRLMFEQWTDKTSGQTRSKHKVVVESVELLGGNKQSDGDGPPQTANRQTAPPARQPANSVAFDEPVDDAGGDGIPF